ncbi:MAG: hypothetical protein WKF81_12810, partial [Thermomicrobiales bacterium]
VRGRRQQGELGAWSTTLQRLAAGTIDVAIQELHWSTINAVGLPPASYPVLAVINLCAEDDEDHPERIRLANLGAERMARATHDDGMLVVAGDDFRLMDIARDSGAETMVVARSHELPIVQRHLADAGAAIWIEDDQIFLGNGSDRIFLMRIEKIASSLRGEALFQVTNAMNAAAMAYATGIGIDTIRESLASFISSSEALSSSFNVHRNAPFLAVVNRIEPPGITRAIVRAANPRGRRRQMSMFGDLSCLNAEECTEIGRLMGRTHGAVLLHSQSDDRLVQAMRRGIASAEYPPLIIHLTTERRALNRMFQTAHPDDVLLIFTSDDGRAANRAVLRQFDDA